MKTKRGVSRLLALLLLLTSHFSLLSSLGLELDAFTYYYYLATCLPISPISHQNQEEPAHSVGPPHSVKLNALHSHSPIIYYFRLFD